MDAVTELAGIKKRVFLNQLGRLRTEVNKPKEKHTDCEWNVIKNMIMELEENHLKNQTLLYGALKDSTRDSIKLRKAMDEDVAFQDLLFSLKLDLRLKNADSPEHSTIPTIPDNPSLSDTQKILMKLDDLAKGILRIQEMFDVGEIYIQLDELKSETK